MKNRQKIGVGMTATMVDTTRATATVIGSARINSPADPVSISRGRKEKMIAAVAAMTGTITSETQRQAASSIGDLAVEKIDVIVDNDNGIVHDDPEDHYERRDET